MSITELAPGLAAIILSSVVIARVLQLRARSRAEHRDVTPAE